MDAVPTPDGPALGLGFTSADLAARDGLIRLDRAFLEGLAAEDAALHTRLLAARAAPEAMSARCCALVTVPPRGLINWKSSA